MTKLTQLLCLSILTLPFVAGAAPAKNESAIAPPSPQVQLLLKTIPMLHQDAMRLLAEGKVVEASRKAERVCHLERKLAAELGAPQTTDQTCSERAQELLGLRHAEQTGRKVKDLTNEIYLKTLVGKDYAEEGRNFDALVAFRQACELQKERDAALREQKGLQAQDSEKVDCQKIATQMLDEHHLDEGCSTSLTESLKEKGWMCDEKGLIPPKKKRQMKRDRRYFGFGAHFGYPSLVGARLYVRPHGSKMPPVLEISGAVKSNFLTWSASGELSILPLAWSRSELSPVGSIGYNRMAYTPFVRNLAEATAASLEEVDVETTIDLSVGHLWYWCGGLDVAFDSGMAFRACGGIMYKLPPSWIGGRGASFPINKIPYFALSVYHLPQFGAPREEARLNKRRRRARRMERRGIRSQAIQN